MLICSLTKKQTNEKIYLNPSAIFIQLVLLWLQILESYNRGEETILFFTTDTLLVVGGHSN